MCALVDRIIKLSNFYFAGAAIFLNARFNKMIFYLKINI